MAQGGAVGRGQEGAPGALGPPQSRVGHPPWGRAWVHSLRQSQEERKWGGERGKNCNSSHRAGHTGGGETRCRTHWRKVDGEKGERREKAEYTDALRSESLSGLDSSLDHCPRSSGWCDGRSTLWDHSRPVAGKQAEGYHSRVEGLGAQAAQRP